MVLLGGAVGACLCVYQGYWQACRASSAVSVGRSSRKTWHPPEVPGYGPCSPDIDSVVGSNVSWRRQVSTWTVERSDSLKRSLGSERIALAETDVVPSALPGSLQMLHDKSAPHINKSRGERVRRYGQYRGPVLSLMHVSCGCRLARTAGRFLPRPRARRIASGRRGEYSRGPGALCPRVGRWRGVVSRGPAACARVWQPAPSPSPRGGEGGYSL